MYIHLLFCKGDQWSHAELFFSAFEKYRSVDQQQNIADNFIASQSSLRHDNNMFIQVCQALILTQRNETKDFLFLYPPLAHKVPFVEENCSSNCGGKCFNRRNLVNTSELFVFSMLKTFFFSFVIRQQCLGCIVARFLFRFFRPIPLLSSNRICRLSCYWWF